MRRQNFSHGQHMSVTIYFWLLNHKLAQDAKHVLAQQSATSNKNCSANEKVANDLR